VARSAVGRGHAFGAGSRRWRGSRRRRGSSSDATVVDQALLWLDRPSAPCAYRFAARPRPHREGRPSVKRSRIVRRRRSCASFRATRTRARRCPPTLRRSATIVASAGPRDLSWSLIGTRIASERGFRSRGLVSETEPRGSATEAGGGTKGWCPLIPADRRIDPYRLCQRRAARSGDAISERRGIADALRKHDSYTGRHRLHCAGCRRDGHRRSR